MTYKTFLWLHRCAIKFALENHHFNHRGFEIVQYNPKHLAAYLPHSTYYTAFTRQQRRKSHLNSGKCTRLMENRNSVYKSFMLPERPLTGYKGRCIVSCAGTNALPDLQKFHQYFARRSGRELPVVLHVVGPKAVGASLPSVV